MFSQRGRHVLKPAKQLLPNELLRYERERLNLSQQEVVDMLKEQSTQPWERQLRTQQEDEMEDAEETARVKASVRTYRRWETGEYKPSPYYQRRLENIFDRTAQELG